jgi:hypothetical protein
MSSSANALNQIQHRIGALMMVPSAIQVRCPCITLNLPSVSLKLRRTHLEHNAEVHPSNHLSAHMSTLVLAGKHQLLFEYLPTWSIVILLHASPRVSNGRLETLVPSLIASAHRQKKRKKEKKKKKKKRRSLDNHVNVSMFSLYWSWLSKIHYEVDYYPFRGWAMWLAQ